MVLGNIEPRHLTENHLRDIYRAITPQGKRQRQWSSPAGTITASGEQSAVDKWLPTIRDNKPSILCDLQRESMREEVLAMLEAAPCTRYAVYVADASTDPVVVAVGIREIATFELEIPHQYYDDFTLLKLI